MKCSKCHHYSFSLKRCKLGKINPPTLKGGADAMEFMGVDYICQIDTDNAKRKLKMITILKGRELYNYQNFGPIETTR